ncbi:hypothetical protein BH09MYX1_BH09MYX1_53660 [soil metagenome]
MRRFVVLVMLLLSGIGCSRIPAGRSSVDAIEIRGSKAIDGDDLLDKLATTPTSKFLGLFRGVYFDYELYNRSKLQGDLERVQRFYADHGFFDARARAARVLQIDPKHVRIEIDVDEREPYVVDEIEVKGADELTDVERKLLVDRMLAGMKKNDRFDKAAFETAATEGKKQLTENGRPYAKVDQDAYVDTVRRKVKLSYVVEAGRLMYFGEVKIEGLGPIPEAPVRRAAALKAGAPYSSTLLAESEQALLELGVFSTVSIEADIKTPQPTDRIPIIIHLEPTKLRSVTLGVGIEFDLLRTDVHASAAWENKNFLGGLRRVQVRIAPGLVLYPLRIDNLVAPTKPLPEVRGSAELRQPGFLEKRTTGSIRFDGFVAPFLLPGTTEDQPVLGYLELKGTVGLERGFGKFFGRLSYTAQHDWPFAYIGDRTDTVVPITLSYVDLFLALDLRDDPIHPHRGGYFSLESQAAGGPFFGDASDLRFQPEARGYLPLGERITVAARLAFGFVHPFDWGSHLTDTGPSPDRNRDLQIAMFRGLYAGGSSSNRGYPLRGIGPHAAMPYVTEQVASTCSFDASNAGCLLPTGGLTSWEASLEVRIKLFSALSTVVFADAADVSPYTADVRFARPHLSAGLGFRYDTPVGPIRLDIASRIPGAQYFENVSDVERAAEDPGTLLGLPVAIAVGIGGAF